MKNRQIWIELKKNVRSFCTGSKKAVCISTPVRMAVACSILCFSWDDHPDVQDFKEQDRIYKAAQKESGADECEPKILNERFISEMKKFGRKEGQKLRDARERKCREEKEAAEAAEKEEAAKQKAKEIEEQKKNDEFLPTNAKIGSRSSHNAYSPLPINKISHKKKKKLEKQQKHKIHKKCHKGSKHRCKKHRLKRRKR